MVWEQVKQKKENRTEEGVSMVIEVNKNIDNYKESVVLGLTGRQLIFSIISLIVGGGIVLLTYPYVGLTTCLLYTSDAADEL